MGQDSKAKQTTESQSTVQPPVSEEVARMESQSDALRQAQVKNATQEELMGNLLADLEKMRQSQAELEAKLDTMRREQGKPAFTKPVSLRGAADADAERKTQAAIWPKDASRNAGEVITRTFAVTPVGASLEQGFSPAIVSNCYDSSDAKAAYMKQFKPEFHHLPVQIHEIVSA